MEAAFDDIIRDEFNSIPSETAKHAYVFVAALGQVDLAIRYEIIVRILDLRYDMLSSHVFQPTEGVLISGEEIGNSRHNAGYTIRARHPVIASIIFSTAVPNDEDKFSVFDRILTQLDPGFPKDRRLLEHITRRKELVDTFASHDKKRAIFDRISTLLPGDPYVEQHRSILERRIGNPNGAVSYARDAVRQNPSNAAFKNTLGMALESQARFADELKRQALNAEAQKLFKDGISRDPTDPYGYIGLSLIQRQHINRESNPAKRKILQAHNLALLDEAFEITDQSDMIATELAEQRRQIGNAEDAIEVVKVGLKREPASSRLRDVWIKLELDKKRPAEALRIAMEGTAYDPTSWRLQRHIARIKAELKHPVEAIRGHYEAALRHNRGDLYLSVELGSYLFKSGLYDAAADVFSKTKNIDGTGVYKSSVREWWKDDNGNRVMFTGKLSEIIGASAYVKAIPENFDAFFWRTSKDLANLQKGQHIEFQVGFNAWGAVARIL